MTKKIHKDYRHADVVKWRNSSRYKKMRLKKLNQNPLCEQCQSEGRVTPGNELDHIEPVHVNPERFWDESNLQILCHRCHKEKSHGETIVRHNNRGPKHNEFASAINELIAQINTESDNEIGG